MISCTKSIFVLAMMVEIPISPLYGQAMPTQPEPSSQSTMKSGAPVSLSHLYGHFLLYQDHLDVRAAELVHEGKDGGSLATHLQTALGFSNSDFAPIRVSSLRLSSKLAALNERAAVIVSHKDPTSNAQIAALMAERESDINAEVTYLRTALGPAKVAVFESFLIQMFSPKPVSINIPSPSGGQH